MVKSGVGSSTKGRTVCISCCPSVGDDAVGIESEVSHTTRVPLPVDLLRTALGLRRPKMNVFERAYMYVVACRVFVCVHTYV